MSIELKDIFNATGTSLFPEPIPTKKYVDDEFVLLRGDISAIESGQSSGVIGYSDKDTMDSDLSKDADSIALVGNDPVDSNNGYYRFTGSEWVSTDPGISPAAKSYIDNEVLSINDLPKRTLQYDPEINIISGVVPSGTSFEGFPAAVRHENYDYIIYRAGLGHVESTPFGTKVSLECIKKLVGADEPESITEILQIPDNDIRDPNILRDNYGDAILVGGVFKVIIFRNEESYGNAIVTVYDLDPTNLSAGLVNGVDVPSPSGAIKSDVRLLSDGRYAFVTYSQGTCYFVTTTDWASFTQEEIGPGNEAAFAETLDGNLNVIARGEESFGEKFTVIYKKPLSSGTWERYGVIKMTLNAPTLVQAPKYSSGTGTEGWLLFARDKGNASGLTDQNESTTSLICLRSKNNRGESIDTFSDYTLLMNNLHDFFGTKSAGDAHYCSVIMDKFSGDFEVYNYATYSDNRGRVTYSKQIVVISLKGSFSVSNLLELRKPNNISVLDNGNFSQDSFGFALSPGFTIEDYGSKKILRVTDSDTTSIGTYFYAEKGKTYYPEVNARLVSGGTSLGRHLRFEFYDRSGESGVKIHETDLELPIDDFSSRFASVKLLPFIGTGEMGLRIRSISASAVTEVQNISISQSKNSIIQRSSGIKRSSKSISSAVVSGTGTARAVASYSNNFWKIFGLPLSNVEEIYDKDQVSIQLLNCTTDSVDVHFVSAKINNDWSVEFIFEETAGLGTFGSNVIFDALIIINP